MKQSKISYVVFLLFLSIASKTCSQSTNQWGSPVFGTQLSISVSNNVIAPGSNVVLHCIAKNVSTNNVCFLQTDSRGMYEVALIDDSGESIELNNPANVGDTSGKMGGVNSGESVECSLPLLFDGKIKSGHYRIVAGQRIFLIKNFDRKNMTQARLISNSLDVWVKDHKGVTQ